MNDGPITIPADFNDLPKLDQIRWYIKVGLLIHPCYGLNAPKGKDPGKSPKWPVEKRLNASAEERLHAFSNGNSDDNVGLVPKAPHGTLDIDDRSEEKRSLKAFETLHPEFFDNTLRARTGDGIHIHFFCPDIPPGQKKIILKNYIQDLTVEIFVNDGLNVICPPSIHPKGLRYYYEGRQEFHELWLPLLSRFKYDPSKEREEQTKNKGFDYTWMRRFRGNLRSLDILALATHIGIYGEEKKETQEGYIVHTIHCPWADEHKDDNWAPEKTSTALLIADGKFPQFICLHTHCVDRDIRDFLLQIEEEHPGLVDKFCSHLWTPNMSRGQFEEKEKGTSAPDGFYGPIEWPPEEKEREIFRQELIYPTDSILHPYVLTAQQLTEGADSFIIGSALVLTSALLSRQVHIQFGTSRMYPNLFVILVGPPGDRKSFTINIASQVAQTRLLPERFLSRNHSPEGLFDEYDETAGGNPDKFYVVDDAAHVLDFWKSQQGERVADTFLTLYDCCPLTETYRRNRQGSATRSPRRRVPETSTVILFGATPLDATFPQQKHQKGLIRRFLYYYSPQPGRFITWPKQAEIEELATPFYALSQLKGPVHLTPEARRLWDSFQRQNREALRNVPEERPEEAHALSSEPTHVLKTVMAFEACRTVFAEKESFSEIQADTLELAIAHVRECLRAPRALAGVGKRLETRQQAEEILARIQQYFRPDRIYPDTIFVDRSTLTRKFCHDTLRRGTLRVDTLYLEIIPYLIETGEAALAHKKGKSEVYAFRVPENPSEDPEDAGNPGNSDPSKSKFRSSQTNSAPFSATEQSHFSRENEANSAFSSFSAPLHAQEQKTPKSEIFVNKRPTEGEESGELDERPEIAILEKKVEVLRVIYPGADICKSAVSSARVCAPAENAENAEVGRFSLEKSGPANAENSAENTFFLRKIVSKGTFETPEFVYCAIQSDALNHFERLACTPANQISLDLETYGAHDRDGLYPHLGEIRLLTVCLPRGEAQAGEENTSLRARPVIFDLKRLGYGALPWGRLFEGREVIAHNAMFEFKWALKKLGIRLSEIFDTMTAARLLQNGIDGGRHHADLATVLARYLGRSLSKEEQKSNFGMEFLSGAQLLYAAGDVRHLCDLRVELKRRMEIAEGGSLLPAFHLDMEYLPVIAARELCGIRFDTALANALLTEARETLARAQNRLSEIWSEKVLLSSPTQVKAAFVRLGFPDIPNTADDTLKGIPHEAADLMQAYRRAEAIEKEVGRLLGYVHPDGRIYPDLDPLGSETARILSSKPTINNLSKDTGVRSCILPDVPGYKVVKRDFSKEEPRIVADLFNVKALKEAFKDGKDIYKGFSAQIFGSSPEQVLDGQEKIGKANFIGACYGLTWQRMVAEARKEGRTLTEELAPAILEAFRKLYPEIPEIHRWARNAANRGLIRYGTTKLGRRRLLLPFRNEPTQAFRDKILKPEIIKFFGSVIAYGKLKQLAGRELPPEGKSKKAAERTQAILAARSKLQKWDTEELPRLSDIVFERWRNKESYRVSWDAQQLCVNYRVQAGGADVIRKAEILLAARLPLNARILLSNHDEICVSCPEEQAEMVVGLTETCMHEAFTFFYPSVPIESKAETLNTWK